MKKPQRRATKFKLKQLLIDPDPDRLNRAADNATYHPNPYHCPGRDHVSRVKPASICPRQWDRDEALRALRFAIRSGSVSNNWFNDFPRYVGYREEDGTTVYEALSEVGTPGRFHAYPVEVDRVPKALNW